MPLDPNIILRGRGVEVPQLDLGQTLMQVARLKQAQQGLTLGELGLAQQRRAQAQELETQDALRGAVGADGRFDAGQARAALVQAGNLSGLAKMGQLEAFEAQSAENRAQAQERQAKVQQAAMALAHPVLVGIQAQPELWEQGMRLLIQQFEGMGMDGPANFAKQVLQQHPTPAPGLVNQLVQLTTDAKRRSAAQHVGMTPIYGTQHGQPVVARLTPTGLEVPEAPAGFVPTPTYPRPLDVGTGYQPIDRAGQPSGGPIPKQLREREYEEAAGAGEAKQALQLPLEAKQAQRTLESLNTKHDLLVKPKGAIDEAIALAKKAAGVWAKLLPWQYQDRANLEGKLQHITAVLGLDELQALRATGATLGQVVREEHTLLQSQLGRLDPNFDAPTLIQELERMKTVLGDRKARRDAAFQTDFGQVDLQAPRGARIPPARARVTVEDTTGQATPEYGRLPRGMAPGVLTEDRVEKLIQASQGEGLTPLTRNEAIELLISRGYRHGRN